MKNNSSRKLLFTTIAIVVLTLLAGFVLNLLTGRDDVIKWQKDNGIETSYLVGAVVFIGSALIFLTFLQLRYAENGEEKSPAENIEPDVKKLHDSLKERYQKRYLSKLDERFEIKLEVSEDWNGGKTQTFNERYDKDAKISKAFPRLKELFDTKDGLLIVGEPGAGKTVLLLKVALNLLEKTYLKEKEAFPVIFNLASWNKDYEDFSEWLKAMLVSSNGLTDDFARQLLREKRLILLLDGLDELARNEDKTQADQKRAACLESLNDYLDREKTVICCRIDEFSAMQKNTAQDAPVSAKVEVLNLTEAELLNALEHARNHPDTKHHASAKNLSDTLAKEKNAALRKTLCTPFYFTIALEVFYKRLSAEINLPQDEEKIGTYLIEKYVERKLEKTSNPNGFNKVETKKWLEWLALSMEQKQLISFELADLQPSDLILSRRYRRYLGALLGILSGSIIFSIVSLDIFLCIYFGIDDERLTIAIVWGFFGILSGFFFGFGCGLAVGTSNTINTEDSIALNFSKRLISNALRVFFGNLIILINVLTISFLVIFLLSILAGLIILIVGSILEQLTSNLMDGLTPPDVFILFFPFFISTVFSLCCGWASGWVIDLSEGFFGNLKDLKEKDGFIYLKSSYQKIRSAFFVNLLLSFPVFLFVLVSILLVSFLTSSNKVDYHSIQFFTVGLSLITIMILLQITDKPLIKHLVLRIALFFEGAMPLKYATFLNYAAEARILEKDGGQWRFRHQNLQEYFANLTASGK